MLLLWLRGMLRRAVIPRRCLRMAILLAVLCSLLMPLLMRPLTLRLLLRGPVSTLLIARCCTFRPAGVFFLRARLRLSRLAKARATSLWAVGPRTGAAGISGTGRVVHTAVPQGTLVKGALGSPALEA